MVFILVFVSAPTRAMAAITPSPVSAYRRVLELLIGDFC